MSLYFAGLLLIILTGCETMEAYSGGDLDKKTKPSTYSYSLPDRYREEAAHYAER